MVKMRTASTKGFKLWEWVALFGAMATAIGIARFVGLEAKWQDAIVYTLMVFILVIIVLRPAWGQKVFWQSVLALLVLHVVGVVVIVQAFPFGRFGFPKLLLGAAGMVEGILILVVLWRRTVGSKSSRK
jgi:hypothetical protein